MSFQTRIITTSVRVLPNVSMRGFCQMRKTYIQDLDRLYNERTFKSIKFWTFGGIPLWLGSCTFWPIAFMDYMSVFPLDCSLKYFIIGAILNTFGGITAWKIERQVHNIENEIADVKEKATKTLSELD